MATTKTNYSKNQKKELGARRQIIEDMFNEYYICRRKIYWMNFVRGICLGFGTLLGGTVVVALVIWLLGLFTSTPYVGDFIRAIITAIQNSH